VLPTIVPASPTGPSKPDTRRLLRSRRDALTERERAVASERITERVVALLGARLAPGAIVATYATKGSEVDTAAIDERARAAGFGLVYPRITDGDRRLSFHRVGIDELVPTRWGLREPEAHAPAVELAAIGAFLLPGLAFDRAGGRVGWGMGHYDVTLAGAPSALRIGLAFDCQILERVPREPHDVALHYIVTEVATYTVA
jgi:5,10-methenyltetrahydrofolate synthetase